MNRFGRISTSAWSFLVVAMFAFALSGCEGSDGAAGATGSTGGVGPVGPPGPPAPPPPVPDAVTAAIDAADAESCGTCHDGAGAEHQAVYNQYVDASDFVLTINAVSSVGLGPYDVTIDFSITYMGAAFDVDPTSADWVDGLFFAVSHWDDTAGMFQLVGGPFDPFSGITGPITNNGGGSYTLTASLAYDIDSWDSGAIVGKLTDNPISFPDGPTAHFSVYDDLSVDALEIGIGPLSADYQSLANVEGCEACHGAPYRKHGNVQASVPGAPDFTYCKSCHYDDRPGGHEDWQYMVDDPLNWANGVDPAPNAATYAYTANVMNDTHMSHAMEFPYPMSMSNCNTCHEGNLAAILDDAYFTPETCKSCHVIEGNDAWPEDVGTTLEGMYAQPHRPPPLDYLWAKSSFTTHTIGMDCQLCHGTGGFSSFADMHSGYDHTIYNAAGERYADLFPVSIDSVDVAGDLMTITFSGDATVIPEVLVSFYGWNTKNFIVGSHERDANAACSGFRPGCKMEYVPITSGGSANPLFTEDAASVAGAWIVTLDMSALQLTKTDPIPAMIADGRITKAEISITPELDVGGVDVVLEATSESFDLTGNIIIDEYFAGANATVDIDKCNNCHDTLASTFHAGSGRGGDGIQVCKACHTTTFPGSHLELASRGIDSYVHAIHTFQPFDEDDVAAANDPVFNARNEQHKHHTFPNFTALSCEGCHIAGTYNVPDQSKSMPGVLQTSWDIAGRNIGTIPEFVTGPASRACGGCHRADLIVHDDAGGLATFNAHTDAFGTLEENDDDELILFGIIDKIMGMFQ